MRLSSWSRSASVAALAISAIAACSSEPVAPLPGRFDGVYVATSVGSQALPRTESYIDMTLTLLADTLRFYSDGVVTRTTVIRAETGNKPSQSNVSRIDQTGVYSIDGVRLTMGPKCGINELCAGWAAGIIMPSRVTLAYSNLGDKAGALVLTRVD